MGSTFYFENVKPGQTLRHSLSGWGAVSQPARFGSARRTAPQHLPPDVGETTRFNKSKRSLNTSLHVGATSRLNKRQTTVIKHNRAST